MTLWRFPLACVAIAALSNCASAQTPNLSMDYAPFARTLRDYVTDHGWVRYEQLRDDREGLDRFVAQIARVSPESHPELFTTDAEQMAYWINAYNALVLQGVLNKYPVKSVRDIGFLFGFFRRMKFTVGVRRMTLDDIEHRELRKKFLEPRIHFAVNCASISCPKLAREPYLPEKLDEQLDRAARDFLQDGIAVRSDPEKNEIRISKIFDWYDDDFLRYQQKLRPGEKPSVLDYLRPFLSESVQSFLRTRNPKLRHLSYDWGLNDEATRPAR